MPMAATQWITKLPGRPVDGAVIETEMGKFCWKDSDESWYLVPNSPKQEEYDALKKEQNERGSWEPSSTPYIEGHFQPKVVGEYQYPDGKDSYPEIQIDSIVAQNVHLRWSHGDWPTETSRAIMSRYLGEWFELFMSKQADYGDRGNDLGLAGQYAELSRKFIKLRKAMWDGEELAGENLEEVLFDLVGHAFLSIHYLRNPELTVYKKGSNR